MAERTVDAFYPVDPYYPHPTLTRQGVPSWSKIVTENNLQDFASF